MSWQKLNTVYQTVQFYVVERAGHYVSVCVYFRVSVALDMRRSTTLDLLCIFCERARRCVCCCLANALESTPFNETHCHANTQSAALCIPHRIGGRRATQERWLNSPAGFAPCVWVLSRKHILCSTFAVFIHDSHKSLTDLFGKPKRF